MLETGDAHLLAEPFLDEADTRLGNRRAAVEGQGGRRRLRRLMEVAGAVANGPAGADVLKEYLEDSDPAVRWWAAIGLGNDSSRAKTAEAHLRSALSDESTAVRVAAARALDRAGHTDVALPILTTALRDKNASAALWAISALDDMDQRARPAISAIQAAANNPANEYVLRVAKAALRELDTDAD